MKTKHLCAFSIIIFMVVAFGASVMAFRDVEAPQEASKSLLDGKVASSYEKDFDKALIHRDISIATWNSAGYALFGEGKEGVIIGQDGWLFTNEEFEKSVNFEQNIDNSLKYVEKVHKTLSGRDIKLFIVPIPAKARIYQDKLGRYEYPSYWKGQYQNILRRFDEYGVSYVNLSKIYKPTRNNHLFLKTDTHWTPIGARVAALSTAAKTTRKWSYMGISSKEYKSKVVEEMTYEGDLMRYVLTGVAAEKVGLKEDSFIKLETMEIANETADAEVDLFSDAATPEITLVGTSYSANKLWNFEGFLKEAMSADVLNVADEGLGPFETMDKYLKSTPYKDTPPKLIIWEMPERYFAQAYEVTKQ